MARSRVALLLVATAAGSAALALSYVGVAHHPDARVHFSQEPPKGKGPKRSYTIEDTAGCSCEQIIDALDLGKGHKKFSSRPYYGFATALAAL